MSMPWAGRWWVKFFKNWIWFSFSNINSMKSGQVATKLAKYTVISMEETVKQEGGGSHEDKRNPSGVPEHTRTCTSAIIIKLCIAIWEFLSWQQAHNTMCGCVWMHMSTYLNMNTCTYTQHVYSQMCPHPAATTKPRGRLQWLQQNMHHPWGLLQFQQPTYKKAKFNPGPDTGKSF